jgi:membrane associated rhomboid family serine protease
MIEAPVGHQCPVCVKEGNKGGRPINWRPTAMRPGGQVTLMVKVLIAANVVVFLLTSAQKRLELTYAQRPLNIAGQHEYYRLLTAAFVHDGLFHIVFNMIGLLMLGPPIEAVIGRVRFTTLYLLSALGGSVCSYLFSQPGVYGVGASGAIFGLFGAYFVLARARRSETSWVVVLIVVNLALSFSNKLIDWRAHVGGLVAGAVMAGFFTLAETRPPVQRRAIEILGGVAVLAALIVLVQIRTGQLRHQFL